MLWESWPQFGALQHASTQLGYEQRNITKSLKISDDQRRDRDETSLDLGLFSFSIDP